MQKNLLVCNECLQGKSSTLKTFTKINFSRKLTKLSALNFHSNLNSKKFHQFIFTFVIIVQHNFLATFSPPCDVWRWRSSCCTFERDVASLSHNHVSACWIIENVWRNCNEWKMISLIFFSRYKRIWFSANKT